MNENCCAIIGKCQRLREINEELLFWMKYIQSKDDINHIHDVASSAVLKAKGETE